ncbi:hypothetical protein IQ273_18125 [Nodosilinea sp. LEGE 07298]|uniref:hypothetical protein n=1 Tax=Nodosilinea sp. LEGE 07298 TaxID=2777970 RepID=UPI00187F8216|nr:hypothetical protein [Nodosilinea sp. LEGE 07298]MBE9111326.1 hypothetical protein [Nodosilinea sp. LEGE 07298]
MDNSSDFIALPSMSPPASSPPEARPSRRPVSFTIGGGESGTSTGKLQPDLGPTESAQPPSPSDPLAPFPVQAQLSHLPLLPRRKRPTFSRHRHDANPALAVKVLQDIQMAVEAWHQDLKQTVQRIQSLYMEGPIVDGWLETVDDQSGAAAIDSALLRHGDPQDLSGYVDRLCQSLEPPAQPSPSGHTLGRPGYRLCNLDSDGRVQHFPCPPDQLSTISLAIARHQKLRQLLDHKQFLEAKLKRTVETMTSSRDALGIAPMCSSEPEVEQ